MTFKKDPPENVLGGRLMPCSAKPMTGFFRDGACNTCAEDHGSHTVCCTMTAEFLAFSKYVGNDLSTPSPAYDFPGLVPGDCWCVCARRWLQAADEGAAPLVHLNATHRRALEIIDLTLLQAHQAPEPPQQE